MTQSNITLKSKAYAQTAGALYLLIAIVGGLSIGYMPSIIFAEGNPALTFQNFVDHQSLFKWGMAGDVTVLIMETVLTVMLYRLFRSFGKTSMTIATFSRFAMAVIMAVNLVLYMIPVIIMNQQGQLSAFSLAELEGFSYIFFKAHHFGVLAWQLFFAIHLFALGYILYKSGVVSKWLGRIMLVGSVGYFGDSFAQFLMNQSQVVSTVLGILLVLAVISEFWLAFWLLFKGKKLNGGL
jgi:hypothetical protein